MCGKECNCIFAIIVGLILGVVVGILFFLGSIASIVNAIIVSAIISLVVLVLTTLIAIFSDNMETKCLCKNGKCALIGSIATLVLTIIALAVTLATGALASAILVGLGAFFVILTVISFVELIFCIIDKKCNCKC